MIFVLRALKCRQKFNRFYILENLTFQRFYSSVPLDLIVDNQSLNSKTYIEFKKYLKNQKIPFKDGNTCLQLECRMCDRQQRINETTTAYINKRTGIFLCPECDMAKPFMDAVNNYEKGFRINKKEIGEVIFKTNYPYAGKITDSVCDAVGIRGLNVPHLEDVGAKYDASSNVLCFPLLNAANKHVGEQTLHLSDKHEETFQNRNCAGLLIHGTINDKSKAVLVTNLLDFLVLTMQRYENLCIICLPYALKSLPLACLPGLEQFKELIFWFNFDSAGWDAAKTYANKMDEKRCLFVRPTDTEPAPLEAHRRRLNLRHILHKALPVYHKSITTFNALRSDVLSDLQNIEKVHGVKWKRFPLLNKLLKGHRRGELTIITGPTGSGKTTFMSEYSLDLAIQGVSTLWGSFEIRNSRLAATLLRQFVGYSLEKKLNEFDYWASAFEKFPMYFMTFHGQQQLKVVMEAIEHAQYVHDINHVIIDNLQFMMGISSTYRTDKFWEQDAIIAAFRSLATKHNVHVTLVMHPRKEREEDDLTTSSVFGSAKATQEADNVLIIQDKRLTTLRGKKYLQVVKNRYSGDLGIMPLEFDKESLSYAKKKKEKEKEKES